MKLYRPFFFTILLAVCFAFAPVRSSAQTNTCTIRGFVYVKATGEGALFTSVYLQGTTIGATTDNTGYYTLSHLAPGTYTIVVASLEYDTIRETVTLTKNQILTKKFYVSQGSHTLTEFKVSAEQTTRQTDPGVSTTVITPIEMKKIPTIGGQPDLAQFMQVVPSVIFTGDQGGQLYIEGGQPIQNKVLLDGMTVFNPFHSIGLFSVFDGNIISDATVYAGGFNADYGDRVSSIMDIRTRDGNKKEVSGQVDASPFGAHVLVEGPLLKNVNDDPEKATASFILSVKNSYLGETSKSIYPWVDSGKGIPFNFADYYGKVSFNTPNGSKFSLFGFNYNDNVNYPGVDTVKWKQIGIGGDFILIPASTSSLLEGNVDYSSYSLNDAEAQIPNRTSQINTFDMGLKFTYFLGNTNVYYGFDISGTGTNFDFFNSLDREISYNYTSDEINGYLKLKIITPNKKFVIEPGFRLQYYASQTEISPEPRFDMKYNINPTFRFKMAAGLYSQNLVSAVDERDVVDLFQGILTAPPTADLPSTFTTQSGVTKQVTDPLEKSYHLTAGFEYDPTKYIHINIEGYFKNFLQTSALNYNKLYDDTVYKAPDTLKKDFLVQSGRAYGGNISVKYDYKEFSIYGVYSLGYVTYWTGTYAFPPPFDRRNNVNLVVSYTFGKDLSWMVDARWNYGSGFPFTPTQGYYPNVPLTNIGGSYINTNANLGIIYGDFDIYRLPDYERLDLSIDKSFQLSQKIGLHVNASVINVLDRENIFYYNRVTGQRVNQLPIMPTLSVAMKF